MATVQLRAALVIACFTAARWRPTSPWRRYCVAVGVSVPLIFVVALGASEAAGAWQRLTNVAGWTWLTVLTMRTTVEPSDSADVHVRFAGYD